ncbi:MAG: class I SAM-dependent methyltransferase [Dehalococcoidia bacterium]|nr:class I SAM-dependent methyltransferase [Dehalococcoidia bacterium]
MDPNLSPYFSGERLYGDDFNQEQIDEWFRDELDGYADLSDTPRSRYEYGYHQLNLRHGFKHLGNTSFQHALGLGSAFGEEFKPIIGSVERLTIVEPSDHFASESLYGHPVKYVKPISSGELPFKDESFDLILCLGTLHHIANVTFVVSELSRVLREGGYTLIREPITSMGDWTKPRVGATKRERGIPLPYMDRIIDGCGFTVVNRALCAFPVFNRLGAKLGIAPYSHSSITALDHIISTVAPGKARYYRPNFFQKLTASSVFYVLAK